MADLPKQFRSGAGLTSALVDAILQELWRWRGFRAAQPLDLQNADGKTDGDPPTLYAPVAAEEFYIQLTAGPDSNGGYDWQEVYHQAPNSWAQTGVSNTASNGDGAYPMEWVGGVHCPYVKDTVRVFRAQRTEGTGALLFSGGNGPFVAKTTGSAITAGTSGNVVLYDHVGGTAGPTVSATNEWSTDVTANTYCETFLRNGSLFILPWDCH